MPEPVHDVGSEKDGGVRLRHSLVLRLAALVTAVAVAAAAVTAWLTVQVTAAGIREERGDVVAAGARIEDALVSYAARHRTWAQVGPLVERLSAQTGNRVTLVDASGAVLADSTDGLALPEGPATTIDPLEVGPVAPEPVDPGLLGAACGDGGVGGTPTPCPAPAESFLAPPPDSSPIAAEAVGPFALDARDRRTSLALAERAVSCLSGSGADAAVEVSASGRADVRFDGGAATVAAECDTRVLLAPFPSEVQPLRRVQRLVDRCTARRDGPEVDVTPGFGWTQSTPRTVPGDRLVRQCVTLARRQVLAPYVAGPVRLSVSSTRQEPTTFLDLSAGNRWRVAGVVLLVLLGSLGFAAVAGRRLVRPLAELATAAGRVRDGDLGARVSLRSPDEIGRVASAFNTMAERREQAESLRKAMVGDVAHELRNPIGTVRGTLEAAQDGLVPVDQALVASLMEETLLLQHVVEDLRDLAAADAGDLRLHLAPVPVVDLLAHVAGAHRAEATARGVTVVVTDAAEELVVDGDLLRLRQVVGNLVSNAVRHSRDGGSVELAGRREGDAVVVEVRDHGEGIAAADLPHVFERFWRADASRARISGGSGLGLAIVRQLAEAHGGTVTATSGPGAGATFTLRLPGARSGEANGP